MLTVSEKWARLAGSPIAEIADSAIGEIVAYNAKARSSGMVA